VVRTPTATALTSGTAGLVAFPTETVYGLGANALDPVALRQVFAFKGRPMSDPLIVHVTDAAWAASLLDLDSQLKRDVFHALAREFWPGPLTMVARARVKAFSSMDNIQVLSASSGMIGVRVPEHPVARALIAHAKVPVAAPSANRFGHVSPTCAAHVLEDLGASPILIVDGGNCRVGIESSVVEIANAESGGAVVLHRRGGVSQDKLAAVLARFNLRVEAASKKAKAHEAAVAPGQLLTHYAPDVETYLSAPESASAPLPVPLAGCVIVDFGGQFASVRSDAMAYRDLSVSGDAREACAALFDALRWTETVPGATAVVLPDVRAAQRNVEDAPALADRLFRAASGRLVRV